MFPLFSSSAPLDEEKHTHTQVVTNHAGINDTYNDLLLRWSELDNLGINCLFPVRTWPIFLFRDSFRRDSADFTRFSLTRFDCFFFIFSPLLKTHNVVHTIAKNSSIFKITSIDLWFWQNWGRIIIFNQETLPSINSADWKILRLTVQSKGPYHWTTPRAKIFSGRKVTD